MNTKICMTLALTLATACGSATGKKAASPAPQTPSNAVPAATAGSILLTDTGAAQDDVTGIADVAASAVASEPDTAAPGASLMLTAVDKSSSYERSRDCTESNDEALVDVKRAVTRDYSLDLPRRTLTDDFSSYLELTRTWSLSGGEVKCTADGKFADVQIPNLQGMTLAETFKQQRARAQSVTNKKTGATVTRSTKVEHDGTRNTVWKSVTNTSGTSSELAGTLEIQKEVTHTGQSTLQVQKADGSSASFAAQIANKDGAPFEILVERDATTLDIKTRTVQSGTLEATHKDGTRVETIYNNVKYDASSDDKCIPVSGEIDGSIFKNGDTTASLTFTITFADDPTITFSNGNAAEYSPDGCELDEPAEQAVDAAKDSVTPPAGVAPAAPSDGTATATATATASSLD